MTDPSVINEPVQQAPKKAVNADIVVGLLTLNNVGTIEQVVKSIIEGLQQFFAGASMMIINYDGGSQDGTPNIVERLAAGHVDVRIVSGAVGRYGSLATDTGLSGRAEDVRRLCEAAQSLQARSCILVEGNLRSLSPKWIELLGRPVYQDGMDYVVPLFRRHRYEGPLVSHLLYPSASTASWSVPR